MNNNSSRHAPVSTHKILPRHLDRLSVVYIRQSTQHQVVNNRESTELQYQLRSRAVGLGWTDERVLVIDDDQGCGSPWKSAGLSAIVGGDLLGPHRDRVRARNEPSGPIMQGLASSLELCGIFQV
jgi:hypothetical protein